MKEFVYINKKTAELLILGKGYALAGINQVKFDSIFDGDYKRAIKANGYIFIGVV